MGLDSANVRQPRGGKVTGRVVDVGNCAADHQMIRRLVEGSLGAQSVAVHGWQDLEQALQADPPRLVLVNRVLDRDGGDGLDIIRRMKSDSRWSTVPVMLITNYTDYQRHAEQLGAEPGFGKSQLGTSETLERIRRCLQRD